MASTRLFSLVEMTVSGTPGTGSITLLAATGNNRFTFAEAGVTNGQVVSYVVRDGTDIEFGIGTYTTSGTSLSRDTVRASKISGTAGTTKLTLTSAAVVYIDCAAKDLDVSDFTEDTAPDGAADFLWMYDTSATLKKKVLPKNLVRERLTAARTYYVRTDGSDSNTGLADSAGGAFLTIQKAIDIVAGLDIAIYDVTIQIGGSGSGRAFNAVNSLKGPVGSGAVFILGDPTTPANVTITVAASYPTAPFYAAAGVVGIFKIRGFTLVNSSADLMLNQSNRCAIYYKQMTFGACHASFPQIYAFNGGRFLWDGDYTISGGGNSHYQAQNSGSQIGHDGVAVTVTVSGTPAFGGAFAIAIEGGQLSPANSVTFSGSATGSRYNVASLGIIQTVGAGTSYFPGNAAGTGTTPGTSPYGYYI